MNKEFKESNSIFSIEKYQGKTNRYIVKEIQEKKIHNTNAYGFKSKEAANRFINYKKHETEIETTKTLILNWGKDNKKLANDMSYEIFIIECKDKEIFPKEDFIRVLKWNNLTIENIPSNWRTMLKYM